MPARIIAFLNNSRAADARKLLRRRCKTFVSKLLSNTSFVKVVGRQFSKKLGGRTIGSTSDSGTILAVLKMHDFPFVSVV